MLRPRFSVPWPLSFFSMRAAPKTLAQLRHELAEKYPPTSRVAAHVLPTGLAAIDDVTGGLPLGAVTEIIAAAPSCGSHLLLGQLLAATRATRTRVALVDAADSFDPSSFPEDTLTHLVWVRCTSASALPITDLLTRDANLGLVVLDLRHVPDRDLRRTPASFWYRLQRAAEPTDLALVVITPRASVPSAQVRFVLNTAHSTAALDADRPVLLATLAPSLQRQRVQHSVAAA
jgi:hypothetical protein